MASSTEEIIEALRVMAGNSEFHDTLTYAALHEAADRMIELARAVEAHPVRIAALDARIVELNSDLDAHEKVIQAKNREIVALQFPVPVVAQPAAPIDATLIADLYELTRYAACSQRTNTGEFIDGLFEQIEALQPRCWAALDMSISAPKIDTSRECVEAVEVSPGGERKPEAWLVPHLLDFKGKRTSCPDALIPDLDGTVAWGAEIFSDGDGVTDKHGVEHKPISLFAESAAPQPLTAGLAAPDAWIQFIDGVKTQNLARTEGELADIKHMFKIMGHSGNAEYVPLFFVAPVPQVQPSDALAPAAAAEQSEQLPEHIYGRECGANEKVWTEDSVRKLVATRQAPDVARDAEAVEVAAKAIYKSFPGADAHPWREGGNSNKQDDARRLARAAIAQEKAQ